MVSVAKATHTVALSHFYSVLIFKFLKSFLIFQLGHIMGHVQKSLSILRIIRFVSKSWILDKATLGKYLVCLDILHRNIFFKLFKFRLCGNKNTWLCTISNHYLFIFFLFNHLRQFFDLLHQLGGLLLRSNF